MKTVVLTCWLLCTSIALADETYAPATPIAPSGDTIAGYQVAEVHMLNGLGGQSAEITVVVAPFKVGGLCARDSLGACRSIRVTYTAGDATALLNTLNTANLTTNSLRRRILTKLATDGYIPVGGAVSGTPNVPTLPTPAPTTQGP